MAVKLLRYAYSPSNSNGLPGNFIWQVVEDAHQDLWLAIKDTGLAHWNRASDSFTVVSPRFQKSGVFGER